MQICWNKIRARATTFAVERKGTTSEDADAKPFWDAFFEVFGASRRKVAGFEKRVHKLGEAAYGKKWLKTDADRVAFLFGLYDKYMGRLA